MDHYHQFIPHLPVKLLTALSELALGTGLGLLSHWLYFIKGDEHHMRAPLYLRFYLLALLGIYVSQCYRFDLEYVQALQHTMTLVSSYCASLFSSIAIYRYFFHRTRSFPGPRLAAITKLWHFWQVRRSRNHLVLSALHDQYGDFIRTGPNEITVFHPDALSATNGPSTDCTKSSWYDILKPQTSLNTIRDPAEHDKRRKLWKPSFLNESLERYEAVLVKYMDQLDARIESMNGQGIDTVKVVHWWAFDIMGELALSYNFNMLKSGEWHSAVTILRRFMALLGPCSPVIWLARIGFSIPGATKDWGKMISFCKEQMDHRLAIKEERFDISQRLVEHARKDANFAANKHFLEGDVVAMFVAGSDTVASTMVYILYHLAAEPVYQDAIRKEISAQVSDLHDISAIQKLPMLESVIKESLRLHPPVLTGGPRDTGADGLHIAGKFIPPHTTVVVPRYHLTRRESCFSDPDVFMPERWLEDSKVEVHDIRGYAPFGSGKYSCIGRALALRELKLTLVRLVTKYDMEFADGEAGIKVMTELRDQFTAVPGPLKLSFVKRELA